MTALHQRPPIRRRLGRPVDRFVRNLSTASKRHVATLRLTAAECGESPAIVGAVLTRRSAQPIHGVIAVQSP